MNMFLSKKVVLVSRDKLTNTTFIISLRERLIF